eukprot:COSAG04_NODE_502_length_13354_cov_548.289777_13_plen_217_part_00
MRTARLPTHPHARLARAELTRCIWMRPRRELENVRSKLTAAEEGREMISKRCDGLGEKTRGLEQELEAAKEEAKRNAELARTAEDKLAAQLSSSGGGAGAGPSAPPGPSTPAAAQLPGAGAAAAAAAAAAAGNPLGAPTPPESPSQEELLEYAKFLGAYPPLHHCCCLIVTSLFSLAELLVVSDTRDGSRERPGQRAAVDRQGGNGRRTPGRLDTA